MFDRPVVAFDIETIPDPDVGRRVHGISGTAAEVVQEMVRRRREETKGSTEYPQLPWHRVVCVCATVFDPRSGSVEIRHLGGEAFDERSHIEGFFNLTGVEYDAPRLVSWNGNGFDLPVLRYRALVHGVAAAKHYRADGDFRWNNYQNRYHDLHVDVMDSLSGFGAGMRAGLGTISELLGVPSKSFLNRPIYDHICDGDAASVVEYCKLDTVATMLVFLVWAFHVGRLGEPELRVAAASVREAVDREPVEGWRSIAMGLDGWPRWSANRPSSLLSQSRASQHAALAGRPL